MPEFASANPSANPFEAPAGPKMAPRLDAEVSDFFRYLRPPTWPEAQSDYSNKTKYGSGRCDKKTVSGTDSFCA